MKEGVIFNSMLGVSMGWMHRGHPGPATTVPTVPQEDSTMQTIPIQGLRAVIRQVQEGAGHERRLVSLWPGQ